MSIIRTVREKWLETFLIISIILNIIAYLTQGISIDVSENIIYGCVALGGAYFVYRYYTDQKYPNNAVGALRAAKDFLEHPDFGIGRPYDLSFDNCIVKKTPPNLHDIHLKEECLTLTVEHGFGKPTVQEKDIRQADDVRREREESEIAKTATIGDLKNKKLRAALRERGLVVDDE